MCHNARTYFPCQLRNSYDNGVDGQTGRLGVRSVSNSGLPAIAYGNRCAVTREVNDVLPYLRTLSSCPLHDNIVLVVINRDVLKNLFGAATVVRRGAGYAPYVAVAVIPGRTLKVSEIGLPYRDLNVAPYSEARVRMKIAITPTLRKIRSREVRFMCAG